MSSASQFKIFLVAVQVGHSARRIGVAVVGVLVFLSACKSVNRAKLSETQDASASVNIESITGCITYWSNQTGTVVTIKGKAGETQNLHVAESRDSTRQKILLFSKFKLPASLTVRSNEIVAAHLAPGYCKDFDKSGIDENKVYTFRVGAGNVGGMATLKRIDGKFHITIPIRFGGSILFGRTAPEFAKEVSKLKTVPDSQLFKRNTFAGNKDCKNLKTTWSIHCFDGLKNRVLQHVRSIEQIYTTDFFELKIDASFIEDESKVVSDSDEEEFMFRTDADLGSVAKTRYGKDNNVNRARVDVDQYGTALFKGLQKGPHETMRIIVTPHPNPWAIFPVVWDVFADSYLLAHEVGHILGILDEGYSLNDYPPNGMMNDETAQILVEQMVPQINLKRTFYQLDLNSLMATIRFSLDPPVNRENFSQFFSPRIADFATSSRGTHYISFSKDQRDVLVKDSITKFLE